MFPRKHSNVFFSCNARCSWAYLFIVHTDSTFRVKGGGGLSKQRRAVHKVYYSIQRNSLPAWIMVHLSLRKGLEYLPRCLCANVKLTCTYLSLPSRKIINLEIPKVWSSNSATCKEHHVHPMCILLHSTAALQNVSTPAKDESLHDIRGIPPKARWWLQSSQVRYSADPKQKWASAHNEQLQSTTWKKKLTLVWSWKLAGWINRAVRRQGMERFLKGTMRWI